MAFPRTCLAALVLVAVPALAHEGHKSPPPATSAAAGLQGDAPDRAAAAPEAVERPASAPLVIDTRTALVHHMHNKIVHFPIALASVGALLLLLSYRWPQFGAGARLVLVLAALCAWVAVRSGKAQEADLEGGELGAWLDRHEDFGEWTAWALTLTAVAALIKQARPVQWLLALIALGLVGYTAFLGGILGHTPV